MNEYINFALLTFTSFFTLINPLAVMPIFMTMTTNLPENQKIRTLKKAIFVSFITILLFGFLGQLLFIFFNISVNSFRIVGGVIFFLMGMDMLKARISPEKVSKEEIKTYVNDISVTPLAIPMICGPGAITNAIVLMEDANNLIFKLIFIVSVTLVLTLTYLILYSSAKITKALGEVGNNVLMRLMGLIVMVIAVEFFFAGFAPFIKSLIK
jgi:multiple antibiotic resistance protein